MGGYGSGFQWSRKFVGLWTRGSLRWSYEGCEPHARIGYEANLIDPDAAWLRLTYTASGNPMDYRVRLVTTQPTYGGRRWWFLCPLAREDGGPPRRVAKLYLPPGGKYFGSRQAYGLTYTSCQESGKYNGLYRTTRRGALNRRGSRAACSEAALGATEGMTSGWQLNPKEQTCLAAPGTDAMGHIQKQVRTDFAFSLDFSMRTRINEYTWRPGASLFKPLRRGQALLAQGIVG